MRYYLVNQSCGPLFVDIVNEVAHKGEKTTLITGQINTMQFPVDSSVNLIKLNRYNRSSIIKRLISWSLFSVLLFFRLLFCPTKSTWLISTNPPLAIWYTGFLKLKNCKIILLVYDIYPEVLAAKKIVTEKHLIYRAWFAMTQRAYEYSDRIISIGNTMTEYIVSQNDNLKNKIVTIPNWNVIRFGNNTVINNSYRKRRNAEGKTHIVYSGNLGATHDFITILEAAKTLKDNDKIVFSMIGDGFQKEKIADYISQNKLANIILEPFKKPEYTPEVYLSADVHVITLGSGVDKISIPSKTYDALAAGAAILVVAPKGSELEILVNEGKCGECFEPGDFNGVVRFLISLSGNNDLLLRYKKASKELSKKYSPENAKKYFEVMNSL